MSSAQGLVVVDMQNAFCHSEGRIFVAEAEQQLPLVAEAVQLARAAAMPVVYTRVIWRSPDDLPLGLRNKDPRWEQSWNERGSPAAGQWGVEIAAELQPLADDVVLSKTRFLCPGLGEAATASGLSTVYLTGTTANNCVYAAALSLFEAGLDVAAIEECVSSFSEPMKQPWLQNIARFLGRVISFADFRDAATSAAAVH